MSWLRSLLRFGLRENSDRATNEDRGESSRHSLRDPSEGTEIRDSSEGSEIRVTHEGTEFRQPVGTHIGQTVGTQIGQTERSPLVARSTQPEPSCSCLCCTCHCGQCGEGNETCKKCSQTTFYIFAVAYFIEIVICSSVGAWLGMSDQCSNNKDITKWCNNTAISGFAVAGSVLLALVLSMAKTGLENLGFIAMLITPFVHIGISIYAMKLAVAGLEDETCNDQVVYFSVMLCPLNAFIFLTPFVAVCLPACIEGATENKRESSEQRSRRHSYSYYDSD